MTRAYYPSKIEKIWHQGSAGNRYQLDSINRTIRLHDKLSKQADVTIMSVDQPDDSILHLAHSSSLIETYRTGHPRDLAESSGVQWQPDLLGWAVNTAWSHIYASEHALKHGSALALADGGHHAEFDKGYGFCPINSLIIAAKYMIERHGLRKIAIIDLDVHYGNGTHSLALNDNRIRSYDLWRYRLDKWSFTANQEQIQHYQISDADEYFERLTQLITAIRASRPELLLYYMGLDVLDSDRMGGVPEFRQGELIRRERQVQTLAHDAEIPLVVSIGGGYINYQTTTEEIDRQRQTMDDNFISSLSTLFSN